MKKHVNSVVFAAAIIITALVLGNAYTSRNRPEGSISVTGLGEKDFVSDLIVWEGNFTKENMNLKQAYSDLAKDKKTIEEYLKSKGIDAKSIVFSAVQTTSNTKKKYTNEGKFIGEEFAGYLLSQSIQITSKEVEKVESLSRQITELLNKGIQFYSDVPRYYYTKLADLKIEMISKATIDARVRAENIAEMSGARIGKLTSAQMGIFQITGQNSNEEYSWGGTFNTTSKEKTASITMKLTYKIK